MTFSKNQHISAFIVAVMLSILSACSPRRTVAYQYHSVRPDGWDKSHVLRYPVDTVTTAGTYTLNLGIRLSKAPCYPYRQLWLTVREHWHRPERTQTRFVRLDITDDNGDVKGTGVQLLQQEYAVHTVSLQQGTYGEIEVVHNMRLDPIPGISDVGIRLCRE